MQRLRNQLTKFWLPILIVFQATDDYEFRDEDREDDFPPSGVSDADVAARLEELYRLHGHPPNKVHWRWKQDDIFFKSLTNYFKTGWWFVSNLANKSNAHWNDIFIVSDHFAIKNSIPLQTWIEHFEKIVKKSWQLSNFQGLKKSVIGRFTI